MTLTAGCHRTLLHHFEQRRLSFRRCTIDLIDEQQVFKDRPFLKKHHAPAMLVFVHNVSAQNVSRHQIRRALHTSGFQTDDLRQGANQKSFAQSRHTFQQHVSSGKNRHQHIRQKMIIANNGFLHF